MSEGTPEPCRKLDAHRPGQRTRKGRLPPSGRTARPGPVIAWIDFAEEVFSLDWPSPIKPEKWIVMRSDPNAPEKPYSAIGELDQFATEGSDMGHQRGCYYVVGLGGRGEWVTGKSNVICNWRPEPSPAPDNRFL